MEFTCVSHREQNDVFILGSLKDILMLLEDNQVGLQTMTGSRFIMGVKDETSEQDCSFVIEVENQRILVTFEKRIVLERCVGRNEWDVPCVSRL
ncbi:hypothetical protein F442_22488 [Phytophthora nicotianae P10297]|uniref:Dynein heavy chain linker domain-containing protein n=2 Tax=Phytophthora nicotianae TaxID=4792 RepID=W2Y0J0_PHYNI|nr:hypothetical protein F442_22488 [Phytophthora nicotianae P10297]